MTDPYVGSGSRPAWTARVANSHRASASSRSARVTMPAARPSSVDQQRLALAGQQLDGLVDRVVGGDRGNGGSMTSTTSASSSAGVCDRVLEQAALADRADDRVRVVRADDRQLRDAVLVQQRDGVADLVVRLDGDQRRDRAVGGLARRTSPTVWSLGASRKPYWVIHASLKIFDR